MSVEKNRERARVWMNTAQTDLDAATVLREKRMFAPACFHAQQAGEKSVKALWYHKGEDPWGHSIKKMLHDFCEKNPEAGTVLKTIDREAMVLDRYYIGTRYPDGLPDLTPDEAYGMEDADEAIAFASEIVSTVKSLID